MITTFGSLIEAMLKEAWEKAESEHLNHRPTIGDMFEGISAHVLETTLPLNTIHVGSGFIETDDASSVRN